MKIFYLKIIVLCVSVVMTFTLAKAQQAPFDVKLWENGLPNSNGHDGGSYAMDDKNYKPVIRVFLPEKEIATGRAIVCYPGGGYAQTSPERYSQTWAPFYNKLGIAFIALHYRVPHRQPEVTISDALEAFAQTRKHAKEWNINPEDIGIQGVSAGGHLASTVATHFQDSTKAAFQILIYPVISFEDAYVHQGSRSNFIGTKPILKEGVTAMEKQKYEKELAKYNELKELYSNEKQVSNKTPRAFIAASNDDKLAMNSILYYTALHNNQVPVVLHVHASGGHGWHINEAGGKFVYSKLVEDELTGWLNSF